MYFSNWTDFIHMEGHGLYVWSAYAVAFLVILYNIIAPLRHKQRIRAQVLRQERLDLAKKRQGKSMSIKEASGVQSCPDAPTTTGGSQ